MINDRLNEQLTLPLPQVNEGLSSYALRLIRELQDQISKQNTLINWILDQVDPHVRMTMNPVSSVTATVGDVTGEDIADMQTFLDGNVYTVDEINAAPGIDIRLNFTEVERMCGILTNIWYNGAAGHFVEMQIWDYTASAWRDIVHFSLTNGTNTRYIEIPTDTDFISSEAAILRLLHPTTGNVNHDLVIGYAALTSLEAA